MRFLFSLLIFVIFLVSCKSLNKAEKQPNIPKEQFKKPEEEILFNHILKDYEDNKFTEYEANKAFLVAKSYESTNNLERAEKLLDIVYKFSPNINVAMDLVQIKILLKKTSEAKDVAQHAYVIFPHSSDIFLTLVQIYQIENNVVQVSNLLDKAYKKFPKNEKIATLHAFYNKKDSKKILINFVASNPASPNALFQLSTIFYHEKKYNDALFYAKKSHLYDPDNIDTIVVIAKIYEEQKNYSESEKFYKNAFEKDMENNLNAESYVNILLFQKKQQEALSVLLKLEASSDVNSPFPPEFSFEIGRILIINQDYKGAQKRLEYLLDKKYSSNISQDDILFLLAYTYENLHLFNHALHCLEKISPDSKIYSNAIKEKIYVYINSNQKELGLSSINNFKINNESYAEDVLFKSSGLLFFHNYEEALSLLNEAIEKKPLEKDLYLKRIDTYIQMKKNRAFIISEAKKIVKKWPNYAEGLNMLGYLLIDDFKDIHYAETLLKRALSFDEKNPFFLDSLGCLYLKKNNFIISQKYFIESLKYSPNEPVILYHYAQLLKRLNNEQEAAKIIEKARTIIANMLIYNVGSDYELQSIVETIGIAGS